MAHKHILFWAILLTSIHIESVLSYLNEEELKIAVDVIEKLGIRHCIFLQDKGESRVHQFWKNVATKLFVTVFNEAKRLANYINNKNMHLINHKPMVIINHEHAKEILSNYLYLFTAPLHLVKWLVFSKNIMSLPNKLREHINYNCQFIIVQRIDSSTYELTELYVLKNKTFFHHFGLWNQGWINVDDSPFYSKRSNLNGTELVTLVPELCLNNTKFDPRICNILEVLSDLSSSMNFQMIQEVSTDENIYDAFVFSFDDILGCGYPFVGPNDLTINLGPLYKTNYNWYIKYPESKLKSDYYLGPFETDFWLAIIFSIMLQTILIIVVKYCLKKIVDVEEGSILSANICVGIETLCNQSGSNGPKNVSFRIIDISLRFLAIFSINSYGAVIISFLTLKFPKIPFSNLNDFFELNEYRVVIDSVLSEQMIDPFEIESKEYFDLVKLRQNYSILLHFDTFTEIKLSQYLERVCKEKLAIAFFDNDLYKLIPNPPCDLYKIDEPLSKSSIHLILSLFSPFQRPFSEKIIRFQESGVFKRMEKQIYETHIRRDTSLDSSFYPVEMEQMIEVLSIPLIGIAIATMLLIFEIIRKKLVTEI